MGRAGGSSFAKRKIIKVKMYYWHHGNHKNREEIARMTSERYKKRHDFEPLDMTKENWSTRKEETQ